MLSLLTEKSASFAENAGEAKKKHMEGDSYGGGGIFSAVEFVGSVQQIQGFR